MHTFTQILIGLVAFLHLYFFWLESFAWQTRAPKVFKGFSKEYFATTASLAKNQGLYNGFLAAGLIWTFFISDHHWNFYISIFFLTCIVIAGVVGAITANKKIFFIQALPALVALILLHL